MQNYRKNCSVISYSWKFTISQSSCVWAVPHFPLLWPLTLWPQSYLYRQSRGGYQVVIEGEFLCPLVQLAGLPLPLLRILSFLPCNPVFVKVVVWLLWHGSGFTGIQEFAPLLKSLTSHLGFWVKTNEIGKTFVTIFHEILTINSEISEAHIYIFAGIEHAINIFYKRRKNI